VVYSFGRGVAEGAGRYAQFARRQGANLAEMSNLGLPVPPGFTITTEVCTRFYDNAKAYPPELEGQVAAALEKVEEAIGAALATRSGRCSSRYAPARARRCRA